MWQWCVLRLFLKKTVSDCPTDFLRQKLAAGDYHHDAEFPGNDLNESTYDLGCWNRLRIKCYFKIIWEFPRAVVVRKIWKNVNNLWRALYNWVLDI